MSWTTVQQAIKSPRADIFRRCYIKRRNTGTGLFEDSWLEITGDVKTWGKLSSTLDSARAFKFTFANAKIVMNNDQGAYNPHDDDASLWYGYLNQQRTLVKIEAGFRQRELIGGHWVQNEFPSESLWDSSIWDASGARWDGDVSPSVFQGLISGDISLSDSNEVTFNLKPLISVFQDYPARNLTGWTTTGFTASDFVTMLRDQTDGAGGFVFRPFFGNTTTNWDIQTTTSIYANLNTSTAKGVIDKNVWEVIEKLAEAENYIPYVSREGVFRFVGRAITTTVSFEFHGAGSRDTNYGHTIKKISSYGPKISKYYSRVQVKWAEADTSTSYEVQQSTFSVSPSSNPWVLGHRSFEVENLYIQSASVAQVMALAIFNEYSSLKKEMDFTTSFIPHLDVQDRCAIYYDPSVLNQDSLWDQNNWADTSTNTSDDLVWDNSVGDAIKLDGDEFKFIQFDIDLDKLENRFVVREV